MPITMNGAYTYEGNANGCFPPGAPVSYENPASFQREFGDACCPRTIYVGNLDPRVDAHQLTQIFSPFGRPTHILIKPALAGISNGLPTHYAFVKFATEDQAKSALHANNLCVFERPIAVAMRKPRPRPFWNRDKDYEASRWDGPHVKVAPVVHKSAKNLYVCNLPLDMEKEELERVFSKFGKVLHCVVLAMVDAYQRKRGFVDMETHEAAELAIGKSDGMEIRGAKLMVGYALVQRSGGPMLNDDGSDFQRFRARPKGNKPRDRPYDGRFDNQNRFENRSDVTYPVPLHPSEVYADDSYTLQDRMNALRMVPFDGLYGYAPATSQTMNQSTVNQVFQPMPMATPRPPSPPVSDPCNLFVKNICPEAIAEDVDLQRIFAVYGTIVSGKIMRWPNGQSKGFGFVSFRNADEAAVARRELDGTVLGTKRIFVSYAERKAERRRRLANIYGSKDAWLTMNGGADLVPHGLVPNGVSNGLAAIPEETEVYGEGYPEGNVYYPPEGTVYYPIEPSWSYPTALGYNQGYPHGYEFCTCPECPSVGVGVGVETYQVPEARLSSRSTYYKSNLSDKENVSKESSTNVSSAEVGTEKSRVVDPAKRVALREGSATASTGGLLQMR